MPDAALVKKRIFESSLPNRSKKNKDSWSSCDILFKKQDKQTLANRRSEILTSLSLVVPILVEFSYIFRCEATQNNTQNIPTDSLPT